MTDGSPEESGPKRAQCGTTPVVIADYASEVPVEGRSAIQVPTIAAAGTFVYFVLTWNTPLRGAGGGGPSGYLMRVSRAGGPIERLATIPGGGSPGGEGLAVTSRLVIYLQEPPLGEPHGAVLSIPRSGGDPVVLATTNGLSSAVVADEQNAYFSDSDGVKSVALSGGPSRVLTASSGYTLGLVDGNVLSADFEGGTLVSMPVGGGSTSVLAQSQNGPLFPQSCGTDICWVNAGPNFAGTLMRLAVPASPVVIARGFPEPHAMLFDGNSFFLTTGAGGLELYRVPAGGGEPRLLLAEVGITSLAIDDMCLYWSELRGIVAVSRHVASATDGGLEGG